MQGRAAGVSESACDSPTRGPRPPASGWRLAVGGWRSAVRGSRSAVRGLRLVSWCLGVEIQTNGSGKASLILSKNPVLATGKTAPRTEMETRRHDGHNVRPVSLRHQRQESQSALPHPVGGEGFFIHEPTGVFGCVFPWWSLCRCPPGPWLAPRARGGKSISGFGTAFESGMEQTTEATERTEKMRTQGIEDSRIREVCSIPRFPDSLIPRFPFILCVLGAVRGAVSEFGSPPAADRG